MCIRMRYLKERVTIILYVVVVIDSEQWYPATVSTDNASAFDIKSLNTLTDLNLDGYRQIENYLPVFVNKYENKTVNEQKWHFSQLHDLVRNKVSSTTKNNAAEISQEKFPTISSYRPYVTFENINVFRNSNNTLPTRPKRKILKRCPTTRPRRNNNNNVNKTRKMKFLEVFEIVQFEHGTCTSSSGLEGTCLHEYECQSVGGATMGSCADGYATCCVIQFACDGHSSSPIGWFTNPGFPMPSTDRISCTVTLDKASVDVQQIRLDFLIFEMLPPTSGTCEHDQFIVSGQNINNLVPILCGINTGQHVYIEVGGVEGPIHLSVQTVTAEKRLYAIKVMQLSKFDEIAAPKGCLQYYKDKKGYLESFNYRDHSNIGIPRYPSYLNNLNYAICIERSTTSCGITYTNAGELQIPNYDLDGLPIIPPQQAGVEIFNCPSDWLLISAIRLCGERLNDGSVLQDFSLDAPVTDNNAGPLVIWFRSDGGYVGRGFKLYYLQDIC